MSRLPRAVVAAWRYPSRITHFITPDHAHGWYDPGKGAWGWSVEPNPCRPECAALFGDTAAVDGNELDARQFQEKLVAQGVDRGLAVEMVEERLAHSGRQGSLRQGVEGPWLAVHTTAIPVSTQVGGDHYETMPIQPFAIIDAFGLDFYAGNALKYLLRSGRKPGVDPVEDLRKARDYLDQMIQRATGS